MARLILAAFFTVFWLRAGHAQTPPPDADARLAHVQSRPERARVFHHCARSTLSNVGTLKQAWSYNLGKASGNEAGSEFTPIVVHGVLYLAAFHYVTALESGHWQGNMAV